MSATVRYVASSVLSRCAAAATASAAAFCCAICSSDCRPGITRTTRPVASSTSTSMSMHSAGMAWLT